MCAVLNYQHYKFPFLTIDKMYAVLSGVKCAVMNVSVWCLEQRPVPIVDPIWIILLKK